MTSRRAVSELKGEPWPPSYTTRLVSRDFFMSEGEVAFSHLMTRFYLCSGAASCRRCPSPAPPDAGLASRAL